MTMRARTLQQYTEILTDVRAFAAASYGQRVKLDDYMNDAVWSRRQVQRALAHYNTNWRQILKEERERHAG